MILIDKKIGRNELCFCGSGKKFKKCCIDKDNSANSKGYLLNLAKRKEKGYCLYPNTASCNGSIINAHTLQNNKILSRLAENGEIITFHEYLTLEDSTYILHQDIKAKGKNITTTFKGFCSYHDRELFKDIDTAMFNSTEIQFFEYAYRAFAYAYFKDCADIKVTQSIIRTYPKNVFTNSLFTHHFRGRLLWKKDLDQMKATFDSCLISKTTDCLHNKCIILPYEVKFAMTDMITLEYDLQGNMINDYSSFDTKRQRPIFLTVFPEEGKTNILLSCFKEDSFLYTVIYKEFEQLSLTKQLEILTYIILAYSKILVFNATYISELPCDVLETICNLYFITGRNEYARNKIIKDALNCKSLIKNMLPLPHLNLFSKFGVSANVS